jgi:hypothetical protein
MRTPELERAAAKRPRSAEAILAAAESRAQERLWRNLRGVGADLRHAVRDGGALRRHPYLVAAAAAIGAAAVPSLLRLLPGRVTMRGVQALVALLGKPTSLGDPHAAPSPEPSSQGKSKP